MGLACGGAGLGILGYLSYIRLFQDTAIGGRPALLLGALLFLTGVILVNFGLIGELLVRTYHDRGGRQWGETLPAIPRTKSGIRRWRERA